MFYFFTTLLLKSFVYNFSFSFVHVLVVNSDVCCVQAACTTPPAHRRGWTAPAVARARPPLLPRRAARCSPSGCRCWTTPYPCSRFRWVTFPLTWVLEVRRCLNRIVRVLFCPSWLPWSEMAFLESCLLLYIGSWFRSFNVIWICFY